jgi:hypothetical protein
VKGLKMYLGAENSPERTNTNNEDEALLHSADSYLGRAIDAQKAHGTIPAPVLENASRFYEGTEAIRGDATVLVKDALCLDGLAELADKERAAELRAVANAEVRKAWEVVGGAEAPEEHLAPILVMEAKLIADSGNTDKARDILTHLNGSAPDAIKDLDEHGTLQVSTVAKVLLGKIAA